MSRSVNPMGDYDPSVSPSDNKDIDVKALTERRILSLAKIAVNNTYSKIYRHPNHLTLEDIVTILQNSEIIVASYLKFLALDKYPNPWAKAADEEALGEATATMNRMIKKLYTFLGSSSEIVIYKNDKLAADKHTIDMTKLTIEVIKEVCFVGDKLQRERDLDKAFSYFKIAHRFANMMAQQLMAKELVPFLVGIKERLVDAATELGDMEFGSGSYRKALHYRFAAGMVRLGIPGAVSADAAPFYKAKLSAAAKFLFSQKDKTPHQPASPTNEAMPSPSSAAKKS